MAGQTSIWHYARPCQHKVNSQLHLSSSQWQTQGNSPLHVSGVTSACPKHGKPRGNRQEPPCLGWRPAPGILNTSLVEHQPMPGQKGATAVCPTFKSTALGSKEKDPPVWPHTASFSRHNQFPFRETFANNPGLPHCASSTFLSSVSHLDVLPLTCGLLSSSVFYVSMAKITLIADTR